MKTYDDWNGSRLNLTKFLQPLDHVQPRTMGRALLIL